jgi:hypothetical protein
MTEKEKFKQEILTAILPEILEYVDNAARAFEAKNEPSWFDKIEETVQMAKDSMSVDKFYKGVSTHSTLHSMITEAVVKAEINKAKEATAPTPPQSAQMGWTGLEPPHPMNIAEFNRVREVESDEPPIKGKNAKFTHIDWSNTTLEDVPVDWMPKKGETAWAIVDGEAVILHHNKPIWADGYKVSRSLPTERLAKMYLESLQGKPAERWKPEVGDFYWIVSVIGEASKYRFHNDGADNGMVAFGNCFQTKQQAESARDKVKELLLNIQQ